MLLRMQDLFLLTNVGHGKYKAKDGLTERQKATLREFDEYEVETTGEHAIVNYKELHNNVKDAE